MKPWHLRAGGFGAVVVAMYAIAFGHHVAWVIAAGVVVLGCSVGEWALEHGQRPPEP